jgi:hypothetical protein
MGEILWLRCVTFADAWRVRGTTLVTAFISSERLKWITGKQWWRRACRVQITSNLAIRPKGLRRKA